MEVDTWSTLFPINHLLNFGRQNNNYYHENRRMWVATNPPLKGRNILYSGFALHF